MPSDFPGQLSTYGPLGIIVGLLFAFCWRMIAKESDRYDAERADNRRLNDVMREGLVEAITKATESIKASNDVIRDATEMIRSAVEVIKTANEINARYQYHMETRWQRNDDRYGQSTDARGQIPDARRTTD